MTAIPTDQGAGLGGGGSVSVRVPSGGREQVWSSEESAMKSWQIGDTVLFRNRSWCVVGRDEGSESLTLTLAVSD
jgi:hypothetical protein